MELHAHLGRTRSALRPTHLLHTPDAFVRVPLPGLVDGLAVVHAASALGAQFVQSTIELAPKGKLMPSAHQRFLFVLEGEAHLIGPSLDQTIMQNGFAYLPPHLPTTLIATTPTRLAVIEKAYEPLAGIAPPAAFVGHEEAVKAEPLGGDAALLVRTLLPSGFAFDFAVNTMTYAPGAALAQVEIHVMEHGLLMLAGAGTYRLGDEWYAVEAGDFIWMAPFCPQWFGALGTKPAKYLIYKNFNRAPQL